MNNKGHSAISVKLTDSTKDPFKKLYLAYRISYSKKSREQLENDIDCGHITSDEMISFIKERMDEFHTSPLEHINFSFHISGITRTLAQQLTRHRAGVSFNMESQRYIKYDEPTYTIPSSISNCGMEDAVELHQMRTTNLYQDLLDAGVPKEDARSVLLNSTNCSLDMSINFTAILHMANIRLCEIAQHDFRKLVSLMRSEIAKEQPELSQFIGIKCQPQRSGMCTEPYRLYQICPLNGIRPHRKDIIS